MKKKVLSILLIVIIIIGAILIVQKIKEKKYNYKIDEVKEYNYYISQENDKYGVIDKEGNTVIDPSYTSIIIPNPEKDRLSRLARLQCS